MKTKNTFKKSALLLAVTGALSAPLTTAIANDAAKEEMDVITVTATRSSLNVDDALTSQVVITREDIDLINPISVLDLLSTLPSIDVANNGGRGQQSSIFMRGTNSGHTLVLIDGIRVSSATTGSTSFSNISPEMIERIEVVQGPRAALWGSDAIGGVIQIFTRKLAGGEHFAGVTLGSEEYRKYKAGIGLSHGEGQTTVTINHEESDGFDVQDDGEIDEDGYEFTSIVIRGQQQVNDSLSFDWLASFDDGETEFDGGSQNNSDTKNHAWLVRANYKTDINGIQNNTVMSIGQNRDHSHGFKDNIAKSIFETRRDQFSLVNNSLISDDFQINVGVDFYQDDVSNSRVQSFFDDSVFFAYADEQRDTTGVFVHGLYTVDALTLEATVRHDDVSGVDSETTYNLGAGLNLNADSRVVFNYGTGFKVPSFNQLYYPNFGTPTLESELSETAEIFFETNIAGVDAGLNFYYSKIDNLIDRAGGVASNFDKVDIKGIEFTAIFDALGGTHDINASYTDAKDKVTPGDLLDTPEETDSKLIRRARDKFNYKFTTSIDVADLYAEYKFVGSREDRAFGVADPIPLGAYQLINLGLNASLSENVKLNARVTNLLDKEYRTVNSYFTQGRAVYIGVTYSN